MAQDMMINYNMIFYKLCKLVYDDKLIDNDTKDFSFSDDNIANIIGLDDDDGLINAIDPNMLE